MKIAYQGEPGAFSEAASRLVSASADLLPCRAFEDVFAAVNAGTADYGVLPIENSIGGSIHRNFDLPLQTQHHIASPYAYRHPEGVDGAALIAGGPYGCAQGDLHTALSNCMRKSKCVLPSPK